MVARRMYIRGAKDASCGPNEMMPRLLQGCQANPFVHRGNIHRCMERQCREIDDAGRFKVQVVSSRRTFISTKHVQCTFFEARGEIALKIAKHVLFITTLED